MKQGEIRGKGMVKSPDSTLLHPGYLAFRKLPAPRFRLLPNAWAMLHRYRSAMVQGGRDRLSGNVEVDET